MKTWKQFLEMPNSPGVNDDHIRRRRDLINFDPKEYDKKQEEKEKFIKQLFKNNPEELARQRKEPEIKELEPGNLNFSKSNYHCYWCNKTTKDSEGLQFVQEKLRCPNCLYPVMGGEGRW